jgi:hypothetical protein
MKEENKKEIMEKIVKGEIKKKPRWIFLAQKLGLQSGMALTFVILLLLVNAFFYYFKTNKLLAPPHSGWDMWRDFFYNFPYDLVLIAVVIWLIFNFIIKKFDFSYKQPFLLFFGGIVAIIIGGALVLFFIDFNETIKQKLIEDPGTIPYIENFYINRCCHEEECPCGE